MIPKLRRSWTIGPIHKLSFLKSSADILIKFLSRQGSSNLSTRKNASYAPCNFLLWTHLNPIESHTLLSFFFQNTDNNYGGPNFLALWNHLYLVIYNKYKSTKIFETQKFNTHNNIYNTGNDTSFTSSEIFCTHQMNNCETSVSTVPYISVCMQYFLCHDSDFRNIYISCMSDYERYFEQLKFVS